MEGKGTLQSDYPILVKKYTIVKYVSIYSIGNKECRNRPQTLSGSLGIWARVAFCIFVNLCICPINVYFIIEKIQKVYIILSSQNSDVHHCPFGVRTSIPTYSSLYVYTCVRCVTRGTYTKTVTHYTLLWWNYGY